MKFLILLILTFNVCAEDFSKLKSYTDTMEPGEWKELQNTKIPLYTHEEVGAIREIHGGANIWGNSGSNSVLYSWNGSAFDGHRWWFFGGGHADYGGNEIYQFDFTTLTWERLTAPSPLTKITGSSAEGKTCPKPENGPASTHTYDGFTWNPISKSIWLLRQSGYCQTGYYVDPKKPFWEFNPKTKQWTEHDSFNITTGYALSAWNPNSNRILVVPKHYSPEASGPFEIDEKGLIHARNSRSFGSPVGNMGYGDNFMFAIEYNKLKRQH